MKRNFYFCSILFIGILFLFFINTEDKKRLPTPTEYIQAKRMSQENIPDGEDTDNWISLRDSKTGGKLYSKVPQYMKKADYEYDMRNKIKSDRPALPLTIDKVRVVHQPEIQDTQSK